MSEVTVPRVDDFEVDGAGRAPAWQAAPWLPLSRVGRGSASYRTRAKVLYSAAALYVLADCEDQRLTCTKTQDFDDIFTEDVVEAFFWPDESQNLYFEYEVSPLGVQLPILVANHQGRFFGWRPWHYEGQRLMTARAAVRGGPAAPLAAVAGWSVEFRLPFALLAGLGNTPPTAGARWRANLYRIDYDAEPTSQWAWCTRTGGNFHDFRNFGTLLFA